MYSNNIKTIVTALVLFIIIISKTMYGQDIKPDIESHKSKEDSLQVLILDKIDFYQSEQNKNAAVIENLRKELEQRHAFSERLNGAVAAARELLLIISKEPGEDKSR